LFVSWLCKLPGTLAAVEIFATDASVVVQVEGNAYSPSEWERLSFLATVPFEGPDPAGARAWVEASVADVQAGEPLEESFGSKPFLVGGSESFRFLSIGTLG
jgi:hypothetical protein